MKKTLINSAPCKLLVPFAVKSFYHKTHKGFFAKGAKELSKQKI
jgi:hypothetical protein